jgi:hypothetical protein
MGHHSGTYIRFARLLSIDSFSACFQKMMSSNSAGYAFGGLNPENEARLETEGLFLATEVEANTKKVEDHHQHYENGH